MTSHGYYQTTDATAHGYVDGGGGTNAVVTGSTFGTNNTQPLEVDDADGHVVWQPGYTAIQALPGTTVTAKYASGSSYVTPYSNYTGPYEELTATNISMLDGIPFAPGTLTVMPSAADASASLSWVADSAGDYDPEIDSPSGSFAFNDTDINTVPSLKNVKESVTGDSNLSQVDVDAIEAGFKITANSANADGVGNNRSSSGKFDWSYDATSALSYLTTGGNATLNVTFAVVDQNGHSQDCNLQIALQGKESPSLPPPPTLSSLVVDADSKIEDRVIELSANSGITGQSSATGGEIDYTDTDPTAGVSGRIGIQSVTVVDGNGDPVALTADQQSRLEGEFSLRAASPATGSGSISWTFQPSAVDGQILTAGGSATISTQVVLSDTDGNTDTAQVDVTETGSPPPTIRIVPKSGSSVDITEGGPVGSVTAQLSSPSTQSITVHTSLDPDSGDAQLATADFVIPAGVTTWTAPVVSATDDDISDDTQTGNLLFTASNSDGSTVQFTQGPMTSDSQTVPLTVNDALTAAGSLTDLTPLFTTTQSLLTISKGVLSQAQLAGYFLNSAVVKQINTVGDQYGVGLQLGGVLATYNQAYQAAIQLNDPVSQASAVYDAKENAIVGVADALGSAALARAGSFSGRVAATAVLEALTEGAATTALPGLFPAVDVVTNWATDAVYDKVLKGTVDAYVRSAFEAANNRNAFIQNYGAATTTVPKTLNGSPLPSGTITSSSGSDAAALPVATGPVPATSAPVQPSIGKGTPAASSDPNALPASIVTSNLDGSTTTQVFNADGTTTFTFAGLSPAASKRYSNYSDTYAADGTLFSEVRDLNDGSHQVSVKAPGHTFESSVKDVFHAAYRGDTTFVFQPGEGFGVVNDLQLRGPNHDTISLLGSDFKNSISNVLKNTIYTAGGATIFDPVSGDIVRLAHVSQEQLLHNRRDIAFHT